jgi:hypothetical protein
MSKTNMEKKKKRVDARRFRRSVAIVDLLYVFFLPSPMYYVKIYFTCIEEL